MTRGYAVLANGKEIKKVAYLMSDACLSGYGLKILKALSENKAGEWFDSQISYNHECYVDSEADKKFTLDWIRPSKRTREEKWKSSYFMEYGYLVNARTGELKVYNYGKLIHTVKRDDYGKYLYYFENNFEIDAVICYDSEKMDYNWNKSLKSHIADASLEELKELRAKADMERNELSDTHLIMPGHSINRPVYGKRYRTSKDRREVMFITEKDRWSRKWSVLIQLPYIRVPIQNGFSSEKKAVECIRKIIRKVGSGKLKRFAEISERVTELYKNNRHSELKEVLDRLQTEWDKNPWYIPGGYFTVEQIRREYSANAY